ncbi:2-C-methyl-D-erythritol 4-phosphate cytidylyltransferase [bacterium]|nr:MAG: 2-C-methyl-D-erythritol 4-phosphate cytidylyltransferase [bacterium]
MRSNIMVSAILLAAGRGRRLNSYVCKPLVKVGARPLVFYSLRTLNAHPAIAEIVVVVNRANRKAIADIVSKHSFGKVKALVLGGLRRQDSVYNGLRAVEGKSKLVLIHDSARPFVDPRSVTKVIREAGIYGAAILAVKPRATIKSSCPDNTVAQTFDRDKLWEIQTPQVFKKEIILEAFKKYSREPVTDDASLVERLGKRVKIVEGSYKNIKITTNEDLLWAKNIKQA